jgi:hypothetical protein
MYPSNRPRGETVDEVGRGTLADEPAITAVLAGRCQRFSPSENGRFSPAETP